MQNVWCIARKELRGFFNSGAGLIFLGAFLAVVLFTFFWVEQFFVRNIADVRPMFEWLPLLMIFLVAALTMRLWSEEQKMGTLEILLTLPVPIRQLVLGKFVAGLLLVALALALTLGLPITVSMMGDLDWGPVIGGYLGALLLASAYLAIGLTVSSLTDNQIVSLIFTTLACTLLYVLGTESMTGLAGNYGAELLRALGTGSRFESIQRGVIDARDLAYYAGFVTFFLVLNTALLHAKRWASGERARALRLNTRFTVALVFVNVIALNVWLAPVTKARVDITERDEHSISEVTEDMLRSLEDPLVLRGYFSARTHPLLAPLVPKVRDLLAEYAAVAGTRVKVEIVDPREDEELEKEAQQEYGIKSVPFQVADRHEAAVVNSYFHILVQYGDQYEVLDFEDLIEVKVSPQRDIEVSLRNLEYDVTRAIKKVVYGFQSVDALFAGLSQPAVLTAFVTPDSLPEPFKEVPERMQKVADELKSRADGKFEYRVVTPASEDERRKAAEEFGIQPIPVSLFSQDTFYLHFVLQVGDQVERVVPPEGLTEADLSKAVEQALARTAPGFLKTIGLVLPEAPDAPPPQFAGMMPPPQALRFDMLREALGANYTVKDVKLEDGKVPGDVDVLLLAAPSGFDDKERFAVDQYLMRGGAVIALAGKHHLDLSSMQELKVKKVDTGLDALLKSYGVESGDALVLDTQHQAFPIPVVRNLGGFQVREIQLLPYPFFVDVRQDGMSETSVVLKGLPAVTLHWANEVKAAEGAPGAEVLLSSTKEAWTRAETNVTPDLQRFPEMGFEVPQPGSSDLAAHPLAVSLSGEFKSWFNDHEVPKFGGADADDPHGDHGEDEQAEKKADEPPPEVTKGSPPDTRLVVVGSANFVADDVLQISRQTGSDGYLNNLRFVENLVDWAVADTDLLTIRSRGSYTRTLTVPAESRKLWEWLNYGIVAAGLLGVVLSGVSRRRGLTPMDLENRS